MSDWKITLEKEFHMAAQARARENEAQARVCARRAAGVVVREYLSRRGVRSLSSSAYDLLKALPDVPGVPAAALQSAAYLTLRVDEQFKLPVDADLVQEARALCALLLPGEFE